MNFIFIVGLKALDIIIVNVLYIFKHVPWAMDLEFTKYRLSTLVMHCPRSKRFGILGLLGTHHHIH